MSRHVLNPMQTEGYQFKLFVDPEEHMAEMNSSSDVYGNTPRHFDMTMKNKLREAKLPEGTTSSWGDEVHGAGLYDKIHNEGQQVRKPAHVIIDPVNYGEPDPYGRQGPMQWEGHHRIAVAAESQRLNREAGQENYHKYVPVEYHETADAAVRARYSPDWPKTTRPPTTTDTTDYSGALGRESDDSYDTPPVYKRREGNSTYWR